MIPGSMVHLMLAAMVQAVMGPGGVLVVVVVVDMAVVAAKETGGMSYADSGAVAGGVTRQ